MKKIYFCSIPLPPSINSAYDGGSAQKRFKSKQYKFWEKAAPKLISAECGAINWPVILQYSFYFPDNRRRDIGNYEKITTDYLVKECVIMDDNHQIVSGLNLRFAGIDRDNPRVEVTIFRA